MEDHKIMNKLMRRNQEEVHKIKVDPPCTKCNESEVRLSTKKLVGFDSNSI